jgi:hypothetical protein
MKCNIKSYVVISFLSLILLVNIIQVMAINQPTNKIPIISQSEFNSPIAPSTGSCIPNEIKDYSCNGNVLHYNQCQQTMSENVWQPRTEVCSQSCHLGKCVSNITSYLFYILIVLIVLIVLYIIYRVFIRRRK